MGKSLRCKTKTVARRLKRKDGEYHVKDAGRAARVSERLLSGNANKDIIGTEELNKEPKEDSEEADESAEGDAKMSPTPSAAQPVKISTSGPRGSRREQWRESKGMKARATTNGMNGKGKIIGKRKAGRNSRRR